MSERTLTIIKPDSVENGNVGNIIAHLEREGFTIVAGRMLPAGGRIKREDLLFMRAPELGIPPDQVTRVVGRSTRRAILSEPHTR